jgi:hypothetical protein
MTPVEHCSKGGIMDKKQVLAALALCLGTTGQAYADSKDLDIRTLKLLQEEGISPAEFKASFHVKEGNGNYSNFSISDGNYSNFSISSGNYSNFSISDGNYSNFSISDANYSNFSISGTSVIVKDDGVHEIPSPDLTGSDIR